MLKRKLTKVCFVRYFSAKKKIKVFFLLFLTFLVQISCDTTEPPIIPPPPDLRKITLTFEDASCTEVWLRVKADSINLPVEIKLMQETTQQTIMLTVKDSVIYIDSLNPNQAYNYQAVLSTDTTIKSEKVTAQTLEPTSHNFTWQTFEFGEHSSSTIYDVAIIDENNIWAVGEIFMNDSLGNPDPIAYNAAYWNGSEWELKRIYHGSSCNPVDYPPFKSIFAFSSTEIVLTSGGSIGWFDGFTNRTDCSINPILTGAINKLWGTSSNDMYVVGNNGNIAHYNGTTWTKIESGTTLNIYDIWGDINPNTNEYEIIALASNIFQNQGNKLLQIKNNKVQELNNTGLPWGLLTVWFVPERQYYVGGDGLYIIKQLGDDWIKDLSIPAYFKFEIRGQDLNDIVLCGSYGLLMHYNGIEWKNYQDITYLSNGTYGSVKIKGNTICASGPNGRKAIITIGKRN